MNRIYISDLDFTLLDSNARATEKTLQGIKTLNKNNIDFTVASARSVKSIQAIFPNMEFKLPVIEFNGAFISDFSSGEHLVINSINGVYVKEIIDFAEKNDLHPAYSIFDGEKDMLYVPETTNHGQEWYYMDRINNNDPRLQKEKYVFENNGTDQIVCLTFIGTLKDMEPLGCFLSSCSFSGEISVSFYENKYSGEWFWITVHAARSQKHLAIKDLIKITGKEDHEIIVFGDAGNDKSMFEVADRAYAVSNADDIIKELATEIIGHHEEDAVIDFILKDVGLQ
jgi:Cof subfamily protein (haloacid dehalogenase superfamily)